MLCQSKKGTTLLPHWVVVGDGKLNEQRNASGLNRTGDRMFPLFLTWRQ